MKLKETLNLGKTAFPMRAGLPNKEPIWQKEWEDAKMYQRRQELNQGKPHFTLHDGPPYANGNIHVGHAMNKISKDIIVRSKSMSGFYAPYVPGWDTHGLPIEQVLAKQGVKRKELDRAEYLKCVVIMHFHKLTNNVKISNVLVFRLIGITHMLL